MKRSAKASVERLEICRIGMVFDPGQGERHSWTGSECVICLRGLWEMETDPALKSRLCRRTRAHSAEVAAQSLPLIEKFDVNGTEPFNVDWRVMNGAWIATTSVKLKPSRSALARPEAPTRRLTTQCTIEKDYLREPCFAAWVVTLCPDRVFVHVTCAPPSKRLVTHYDFSRVYLSQFFPSCPRGGGRCSW